MKKNHLTIHCVCQCCESEIKARKYSTAVDIWKKDFVILSVIATKLSESVTGMAEKMTYKQYAVEG